MVSSSTPYRIDNATPKVDSEADGSVRTKISGGLGLGTELDRTNEDLILQNKMLKRHLLL